MTFEAPRAVWRFCAHIRLLFCAGRAHGRAHGLAHGLANVKNACVFDCRRGCGATATVLPACPDGDVPGVAGVARTRETLGDHGAQCCGFFVAFHVYRAERAGHADHAGRTVRVVRTGRSIHIVRVVCTVCIYHASRGVCLAIGRDDYRQRASRGVRIQTVGHGECDVPYLRGQL